MKERFKTIIAVYLIMIRDKKVLLSRRYNTGYFDGSYSLPAGHLEKGETLKETMIREGNEELGIALEADDLKLAHTIFRNIPDNERISFFFTAEKWSGEITNMEPEKCDDLEWFSLDELPENMIPYVKEAINFYLNGINYSERED